MRRIPILLVAVLVVAGCGDDSEGPVAGGGEPAAEQTATAPRAQTETEAAPDEPPEPKGTEIAVDDSEFGSMLFDSKGQAIYIFENDSEDKTVCYDDCAEAWPPVFTKGEPRAGAGVKQSLLGTVKRRDGKLQVTYADKPLYFYAHEERGEVRCHNVNLNGGLWWVIGPDGDRRP